MADTKFKVLAELLLGDKQFVSQLKSAMGKVRGEGNKAADSVGARFKKAFKGAAKLARQATFAGVGAFTAAVALGARDRLELEKVLADISVQASSTDEEMANLAASIRATSAATAISQQDLAETSKTLVDLLGPAGQSAELMDLLGRTAVASGAKTKDLAGLVSSMSDSFGIATDDIAGMESGLSAFLAIGKQGKVPLETMASVLQDVSSTFKDVSGGGVEAAADLAAALQVARTAFGSAEKAGTGLEAFVGALVKKSKELRKVGVKVFDVKNGKRTLKPIREIFDQIAKRKLDVKQLQTALGRKEAVKFLKAFQDPKGRQFFEELSDAGRDATDVSDDFGKRTETSAFRIANAMNDGKLAIAELFSPERIELFITALGGVVGGLGEIVDGLSVVGTGIGEAAGFVHKKLFGTKGGGLGLEQGVAQTFGSTFFADLRARRQKVATEAGALRGGKLDPEALAAARQEVIDVANQTKARAAEDAEPAPAIESESGRRARELRRAGRPDIEVSEQSKAILELADQPGIGVAEQPFRADTEEGRATLELERQIQNEQLRQQIALVRGIESLVGLTKETLGITKGNRPSPAGSGRSTGRSANRALDTGTRQ